MVIFLLILGGLIAFNFVLLKFSIQSVESNRKKAKSKTVQSTNAKISKPETTRIPEAA